MNISGGKGFCSLTGMYAPRFNGETFRGRKMDLAPNCRRGCRLLLAVAELLLGADGQSASRAHASCSNLASLPGPAMCPDAPVELPALRHAPSRVCLRANRLAFLEKKREHAGLCAESPGRARGVRSAGPRPAANVPPAITNRAPRRHDKAQRVVILVRNKGLSQTR